jgi:hypothetical protein
VARVVFNGALGPACAAVVVISIGVDAQAIAGRRASEALANLVVVAAERRLTAVPRQAGAAVGSVFVAHARVPIAVSVSIAIAIAISISISIPISVSVSSLNTSVVEASEATETASINTGTALASRSAVRTISALTISAGAAETQAQQESNGRRSQVHCLVLLRRGSHSQLSETTQAANENPKPALQRRAA